jgi:hypothetical protein
LSEIKFNRKTYPPLRLAEISVNLCESVVKKLSIKNNKLCKTNPISERLKMNISRYKTGDYENKSPPSTMEKQTQSNPILPPLRLAEIRVNPWFDFL